MGKELLAAGLAGLALGGCTTTSFAPPEIDTRYSMSGVEPGTCAVTPDTASKIEPNVAGAHLLIDNFLAGYKCASREASNGRQSFEVPSFLALVAAGVGGPLYGLSRNEQLAAGAYSAVMGRANSYYAPKEKADLLRAAINGVTCIGNAAVGYDHFDADAKQPGGTVNIASQTTQEEMLIELIDGQLTEVAAALKVADLAQQERTRLTTRQKELADLKFALTQQISRRLQASSIQIDAAFGYVKLVRNALVDVDTVLEKRLSDSGTFDPASLSGELENLTRQEVAAETQQANLDDPSRTNLHGASLEEKKIEVQLVQLHARLQKCVVRAKMT
jgi:hypothetical protein